MADRYERGGFRSGLEADPAGFRLRLCHELPDRLKYDSKLGVVFLLKLSEPPGQNLVRADHPPQTNKGSHNGNVHLNGSLASQHAGKHCHTLLGEGIGIGSPETAST